MEAVLLEVSSGTIAVAEQQLFYRRWCPQKLQSTIPIVLLHDSLGCVALWRDFPEQLAQYLGCEVIAYDRLGFGQSSMCEKLPSADFIQVEAEQVFPQLKKALGLCKYVVLGHSVGGAMALNIAADDKDCLAVISMAAQAYVEQRTLDGIIQAKTAFAEPQQFARLTKWHGEKALWVLNAWTKTWLATSFASWRLDYCLADVSCPNLIIHGEQDEFGSCAFAENIAEHTSGETQLVLLPDCAHNPHREQRSHVLALIANFVQVSL